MRWTRQRQAHACARRMTLQADGEAVWSWRPDAGVKFRGKFSRGATVTKKPGHRGEHGISVKTIAQGMPVEPALLVVTTLMCFYFLHVRLWVRAAHPAFPAPLFFGGWSRQSSGTIRAAGMR